MRSLLNCHCFFIAIMFCLPALSQTSAYILNGSATRINCNCYTLTQAVNSQSGSVWNANKINLDISFDFIFNVYLGCKDASGADGIVFMLQPLNTSVGAGGQGIGFLGVTPSVGIVLDTWQNIDLNDPAYDHKVYRLMATASMEMTWLARFPFHPINQMLKIATGIPFVSVGMLRLIGCVLISTMN